MFENKKEFIQDIFDMRIFGAEELSENIKKFADDKLINEIAEAYNAVPTTMGFTLTNKIEAKDQEFGSGGSWHRDSYFRQFKSILYLNDVNENNGPFQIVTKSNKSNQIKKDTKIGNLEQMQSRFDNNEIEKIIENEPERVHTLTGKAGTLILVDTSTIHRGKPLKNGIRYALTNYFFEKTQINSHLIEHFSPLVSPEKVLKKT
jgi:ectoine hydroxylase-related dioxygenase (phytanoyl-CoA dioxygenase family)